jgi:hypothetical protein
MLASRLGEVKCPPLRRSPMLEASSARTSSDQEFNSRDAQRAAAKLILSASAMKAGCLSLTIMDL